MCFASRFAAFHKPVTYRSGDNMRKTDDGYSYRGWAIRHDGEQWWLWPPVAPDGSPAARATSTLRQAREYIDDTPRVHIRPPGEERTSKCPECGNNMVEIDDPGIAGGTVTPDYACDHCGLAVFDTANDQRGRRDEIEDAREDYHRDTGFLPGR